MPERRLEANQGRGGNGRKDCRTPQGGAGKEQGIRLPPAPRILRVQVRSQRLGARLPE